MTRREHIEQLATEQGAPIHYTGGRYHMAANVVERYLVLAPWDGDVPDEELYWVALHELGHLGTGLMPSALIPPELRADDEAQAWLWAVDHSEWPVDQAAESSIAWGIADRIHAYGWVPSPALERIYQLLGPEPDWYMNVTEPIHWEKLEGYAKPAWAELAAYYGPVSSASSESESHPAAQGVAQPR